MPAQLTLGAPTAKNNEEILAVKITKIATSVNQECPHEGGENSCCRAAGVCQ